MVKSNRVSSITCFSAAAEHLTGGRTRWPDWNLVLMGPDKCLSSRFRYRLATAARVTSVQHMHGPRVLHMLSRRKRGQQPLQCAELGAGCSGLTGRVRERHQAN